ncbi:hypothetical protein [Pseudomonas sp. CGJS7]|uniref:hypothetical protein n=1 Tax=Pseudomonas sp. CGJS7 TaxID=3109348 RepID=UPI00300B8228
MRVLSVLAAGLGLAAAVSALPASAQAIAFPSPNFRGGNTDWQTTLATQQDLAVVYSLQAPGAKALLVGALAQQGAPQGQYKLTGTFGKGTPLTVAIAPVALGKVCKDNNGKTGGPYGAYTYAITVTPQGAKPSSKTAPWPTFLYGCGVFTSE